MSSNNKIIEIWIIIYLINCESLLTKADCGLPAIPEHIELNIHKSRYEEGTQVSYECSNPNSELVDGKYRFCINNKWNQSLPRCATFLEDVKLKHVRVYQNSGKELTYNRIDFDNNLKLKNQRIMCEQTKKIWRLVQNQMWRFHVSRGQTIDYFIVFMKGQNITQLNSTGSLSLSATIYDIGYSKLCAFDRITILKDIDIYKLGFICNADRNKISKHEGIDESLQEIVLYVKISVQEIRITFCDLRIYGLPTSCGSPEKVLNSEILNSQKSYTIYACRDGYELSGDQKVVCNKEGKWSNNFPTCTPNKTCKIPALETDDPFLDIKYKKVIKINGTLVAEPDSVATYTCKNQSNVHKMQFSGQTIRFCKNGLWTSSQPTCSVTNKPNYNMSDETISNERKLSNPMPNAKQSHKEYYVIIAMMGSFIVGGVSVAFAVYLVMKKQQTRRHKQNISIIINEADDLDSEIAQEFEPLRHSQLSQYSNEIVNPLYEKVHSYESQLSINNK